MKTNTSIYNQSNNGDDPYEKHKNRIKENISFILSVLVEVVVLVGALVVSVYYKNFNILLGGIAFATLLSLNLLIVKQSRYYLKSVVIGEEKAKFIYFDKDKRIEREIPYTDIDLQLVRTDKRGLGLFKLVVLERRVPVFEQVSNISVWDYKRMFTLFKSLNNNLPHRIPAQVIDKMRKVSMASSVNLKTY